MEENAGEARWAAAPDGAGLWWSWEPRSDLVELCSLEDSPAGSGRFVATFCGDEQEYEVGAGDLFSDRLWLRGPERPAPPGRKEGGGR